MSTTKPPVKLTRAVPGHDRSNDVLRSAEHPLDAIFSPRTVAVIGASERPSSIGRAVLWSLLSTPFDGTVYPISDKRSSVLGIKAYRSLSDVPERIDLAVIVTPAPAVPAITAECVAAGVPGIIVISAGFKEHGEEGKRLEQEILSIIHGSETRLIGPNCFGVMNPLTGLNATSALRSRVRATWLS